MSQNHLIVGEYHFRERAVTTVLIVEDDPLIALSLQMVLEDEGYEVCGVAATERQAISLGLTHRPDVAVVDVRLAEGSGIEAGRNVSMIMRQALVQFKLGSSGSL